MSKTKINSSAAGSANPDRARKTGFAFVIKDALIIRRGIRNEMPSNLGKMPAFLNQNAEMNI